MKNKAKKYFKNKNTFFLPNYSNICPLFLKNKKCTFSLLNCSFHINYNLWFDTLIPHPTSRVKLGSDSMSERQPSYLLVSASSDIYIYIYHHYNSINCWSRIEPKSIRWRRLSQVSWCQQYSHVFTWFCLQQMVDDIYFSLHAVLSLSIYHVIFFIFYFHGNISTVMI